MSDVQREREERKTYNQPHDIGRWTIQRRRIETYFHNYSIKKVGIINTLLNPLSPAP